MYTVHPAAQYTIRKNQYNQKELKVDQRYPAGSGQVFAPGKTCISTIHSGHAQERIGNTTSARTLLIIAPTQDQVDITHI